MRRLALLVAVSSVAALSGLNVPADAANGGRSDEHRRIVDYWTPERQANAIPRDMSPQPRKKPGGGGGSPTTSVTGAAWTQGGTVAMTTGKVFFTLRGVNYVCSGSAVDSSTAGNLVLSAGHCVHDGEGGPFATNWMFAPRYNRGADPVLGVWTASELHTTPGWANSTSGAGFNDDVGFAVLRNNGSNTLVQALTAVDATVKIPTVRFDGWDGGSVYWSFGYPAARPYTGTTLTYCAGTTRIDRDALDTMALPCNMTGGSSGGPWLVEYTPGNPVIESVNSYGYSSMKNTMFGPIFGVPEQAAYNAAKAAGCTASKTTACLGA